ncbi:MAG TPA: ABC transporter ATP-binding protein [Alphaproteobacteria bacterium]|nr:ABC transporter ATP-binding protein [Alphaproteobacteria bacterium]
MLSTSDLDVGYGDAPVLWDVAVTVGEGELVSVVGPNGAGKTTLVNALARLLPVRKGRIVLDGRDVTGDSPQQVCGRGIAIIPEGRRLFVGMTVQENLELGCYRRAARAARDTGLERVYTMFPILKERRRQIAGTLSGGQQQMVAIGRALMAQPKLILVDEPSLGLAPIVAAQVFEVLQDINRHGVSILLIEQNVSKALEIAQRAYVLENGRIAAEGSPAALLARPEIRTAYLGLDAAER